MDYKLKLFMQMAAEKKIVSLYEEMSDTESSDDDITDKMNKLSLDTDKCYIEGELSVPNLGGENSTLSCTIKFIIDPYSSISTIPMKIIEKYNIDTNPITLKILDQNITYQYTIDDNKYCVLGQDVISKIK
jgi:hypothetical protein